MSWKQVFVGSICVCAWAGAHAAPSASSSDAGPSYGKQATSGIELVSNSPGRLASAPIEHLGFVDTDLPELPANLNEQIVRIPVDAAGTVTLETTIFRPDGPGPFPMIVFNHGKTEGDPHNQSRSRPIAFAREFVRRGYVVVAPNREGFAESGGSYHQEGCDVEKNGVAQAGDVAAAIAYMSKQSYVDASHIVVAGTSHGGLTTIAYGSSAAQGVRGLINFSGGLRQDACTGWQDNLTQAFGHYGEHARVPSLWLYGDNDSVWTSELTARMYGAYVEHGAHANMIDYGSYKNDAHRLVVDRDGVQVWWPVVDAFLARVGMPTRVAYRVAEQAAPHASGYATVDSVSAVPYVDAAGRAAYRKFLSQYPSRAFALSSSGAWSWAEGGDDPRTMALASCRRENHGSPCRLYAVDDTVVWNERSSDTTQTADSNDETTVTGVDALASRN
ncbi:dienelactone hydrolase family protein [Trinickia fusca]|uniref:Peptidase S9 prolyl oligopeptidase catalytic domain-containing protein n=1 Tax=Trinickia fusca TaxID=2419777 RepID=A0A494XPU1_9BURK|nr:prolyl oligopeptidase family serine peptidase [Trinickia fusca]RKP49543.1 hypothetical protein D7S89_11145 [Trinickia fusca]